MNAALRRLFVSAAKKPTCLSRFYSQTALRAFAPSLPAADDWYQGFDPQGYQERRDTYDSQQPRQAYRSQEPYQREEGDNAPVDEATVVRLVDERDAARREGNYEVADRMRDELREKHGVRVFDTNRTWRAGVARDLGYRTRSRNFRDGKYGKNGHDYEYSPDAGPNSSGEYS